MTQWFDAVVCRASIWGCEPAPDETTACKFRHLLEEHGLGGKILETVNLYLQSKGVKITTGTIVDATIIDAPCSTKNRERKRDRRDAPNQEGEGVVFRDEGAHRGGQQDEVDALGGGDGGQRAR